MLPLATSARGANLANLHGSCDREKRKTIFFSTGTACLARPKETPVLEIINRHVCDEYWKLSDVPRETPSTDDQHLHQPRLNDKERSARAIKIAQITLYTTTPRRHSTLTNNGFMTPVANSEPPYLHLARDSAVTVSCTQREASTTSYRNSLCSAGCQNLLIYTRCITQWSVPVLTSRGKDTQTYLILMVGVYG